MTAHLLRSCGLLTLGLGLSLAAGRVRADVPAELAPALDRLTGQDPLAARVELETVVTTVEGKKPTSTTARAAARVVASPEGLAIHWSDEQLRAAVAEADGPEAEHRHPVRRAMETLSVTAVDGYLNGARELRRELRHAQLTATTSETLDGQPTRVLQFKLSPPMGEKERKYIKEFQATARVWIDAAGTPVAAESRIHVKGRALLVISFESTQTEQYRFAQVGSRLVVVRHTQEQSGSGGGENNQQKTTATLVVEGAR